jgi:NADH:ubiquinone oxidoreductase subunit
MPCAQMSPHNKLNEAYLARCCLILLYARVPAAKASLLRKVPAGGKSTKLMGEDALGNKYYEDNTRPYGRHRWVVYKDMDEYHGSQVTSQWHAWLHCITDETPLMAPPKKHKFDIEYVPCATGTAQQYLPKGSWENPQQRNWCALSCHLAWWDR